jgi:hypothetical protein
LASGYAPKCQNMCRTDSPEEKTAEHIPDEAEYQGLGIRFPVKPDTMTLNMQLDIGLPVVRFYGPTDEYRDKSWQRPEVELLN